MNQPMIARVPPQHSRPLWSVMIPTYRPDVRLLREAIASVIAAGIHPRQMQVSLVDDGADDVLIGPDADAFWQECRDRGLEVHRFEQRLGLAGNWNRCLELARGHLIHILHQDDRVRNGFYDATEAGLKAEPTAGASFTQHVFIAPDGRVLRQGHLEQDKAGLLDDWLEHVVANLAIQCPAMVVRRAVYEYLGGFDESYRYCLDREMWQRIAAEYPIWYDPRPLAEFRVHEHSASSALRRKIDPWLETKRCVAAATRSISPPARNATVRSARRHLTRLALNEARLSIAEGKWSHAAVDLAGALSIGRIGDFFALARGRYHHAPRSRPPVRGANIDSQRQRRILLLTEFFPGDPEKSVFGAFQRLRRHLEALDLVGQVDLVFFWPEGRDLSPGEGAALTSTVKSVLPIKGGVNFISAGRSRRLFHIIADTIGMLRGAVGFFHTRPSMRTSGRAPVKVLRRLLAETQPDLIFAYRLGAAAPLLRVGLPLPPVVVDTDDLEHVKLERLAMSMPTITRRLVTLAWAALARHATRCICKRSAHSLVSSELDRRKLIALCPSVDVVIIPNTAESFGEPVRAGAPVAICVGTLAYHPNREGASWLANEVWPQVRSAVPQARLLIVGDGAESLSIEDAQCGIETLGFVPDLAPIYQSAMLAVCPIHRGSGTRIKIIEAAMNARPVVSTSVGAEGLSFEPDAEIVLADSAQRFAEACIALLQDPVRAECMGEAARRRARSAYDPLCIARQLATVCAELMQDQRVASATRVVDALGGFERNARSAVNAPCLLKNERDLV